MARSRFSRFVQQTWTLTKKILLIAVLRHWRSTLFRSLILPIPYLILLLYIKDFLGYNSTFGIGSPQPVNSLVNSIPSNKKFAIVQPLGLGPDVEAAVHAFTAPLQQSKQLAFLNDVDELLTTCRQDIHGNTDCFAAVVFNDSPLTSGGNNIWNYTIRGDSYRDGAPFHATTHNNDEDKIYLPLQVALENAITNSTITPDTYMFTSFSQAMGDEENRQQYQHVVIRSYGVAFFIALTSVIYHLTSMLTSERESGMTQLIDAMGGSPAARIWSYVLAFNIIYLPSWIIFGALYWHELFTTSSVAVSLFWQIFTGMAVTSASVFAAMFFTRAQISGVFVVIGFLLLGLGAQILDTENVSSAAVGVLSFLFPSMNFQFLLGYICRYEAQGLATDLLRAPPSTRLEPSTSRVPGIALWIFLIVQVFVYPLLALYTERWIHGTKYKSRSINPSSDVESSLFGVEALGLTKIYLPTFRQKWFTRGKKKEIVAVQDLNLQVRKGQLLCLLGANGSGKTTTLDMIGGLQKPTSGSIRVDTEYGHVGICPQKNILWDELTVDEHIRAWRGTKGSNEDRASLDRLIDSCDLAAKRHARAATLSGGQKRKLQLACMFVGGSSVCLLDEVTSGLDPLSRQVIWSIILSERSQRTMILTTHFLDEAEVLADHIAIISRGSLRCEGSAVELKMQLGKGYQLHVPTGEHIADMGFPTMRRYNETVMEVPDSGRAANIVAELEGRGYSDIIVNGPTIEDVFLRVADEARPADHDHAPATEKRAAVDIQRVETGHSVEEDEKLSSASDVSSWRQTGVLFQKRWTLLRRNWWPYLIVLVIPIAATPPLRAILSYYHVPSCLDITADVHPIQPLDFATVTRYHQGQLLVGPSSINDTLYNVVSKYPIGGGIDLGNYSNQITFASSFDSFQNDVSNQYASLSPGVLWMDSNSSAPTYAYLGDDGILAAMFMQNLWTQVRSGIPIAAAFSFFDSLVSPTSGSSLGYISYFCLALAVYPAFFALYPTYEKVHGVRSLQYSNGVRPLPLWCAHVLFDFLFILLSAIICTVVIAVEAPAWFQVGVMFPIFVLYGMAAALFAYVISTFAKSQLGAFGTAAGIQSVMFILSALTFSLIETFDSATQLQTVVDATSFSLNIFFPIGNVFRAMLVGLNVDLVDCRNNVHLSYAGSIYAYGGPILYLCVQVCFYLWLLVWLESVHALPRRIGRLGRHNNVEELAVSQTEEVTSEKDRVEEGESDLLRVLHLTKSFGYNVAVDDVSFGIGEGEIFALLGPNGAGKSTVVNLLRGLLLPDDGVIQLQGTDIVKNIRAGQKHLGVCPQFDALDQMTVREHLDFYARAKGVRTVSQDISIVLRKVGLQEYSQVLASKLSGGTKRKLSLAIALIGNPSILLLDEPSSSLDAVSKRGMWKTLADISFGRSMLLTTHSMEEAAAIATRAAIMAGRILTVGRTEFLRRKYGGAYHVHMVLKSAPASSTSEMIRVEEWVKASFPGARLDPFGSHQGQIKFEVPDTRRDQAATQRTDDAGPEEDVIAVAGLTGSHLATGRSSSRSVVGSLFRTLEKSKDDIGLLYYSVGATTLNDVFLNVVRENNVKEEGTDDAGKKRRSLISQALLCCTPVD